MLVGIRFEVPPPVPLPAGLGWQQFCDGWSVGLELQTSTEFDLCQFNKFGGDSWSVILSGIDFSVPSWLRGIISSGCTIVLILLPHWR